MTVIANRLSDLVAGVLVATLLLCSGCVESRCYGDADCPAGQVCLMTGKCMEPECTAANPCPEGHFCSNAFCQKGCLADAECGDGFKCIGAICTPYRAQCDCTGAPPFCAADLNPNSPGSGQTTCSDDPGEGGVGLFFGSIKCSHCWSSFERVEAMRDELLAEGYPVVSYFVHLRTVNASPETVGEKMPWASSPVVADTDDLAIWDDYLADWYHFVIVDRHGCVARHFGPVVPEDFDGESNAIRQAWIDSLSSECPSVPTGEDIGPDQVDAVALDLTAADIVEVVDSLVPDVLEVMDSPGDAPIEEVVEPLDVSDPDEVSAAETTSEDTLLTDGGGFEPAEFCQVVPTDPIAVGEPAPTFLCVDDNPSSASHNGTFSPASLKGKVWLAYFGSCT